MAIPEPRHTAAVGRLLDGRLKLRHLTLVDAVTAAGSLVGAAAALHVTQPVVTRSLRELEEALGVQLYVRGPRGVTPTEFGLAFTDHARSVLAQLGQAARHLDEIGDASRGQVVVGSHLAGSNLLLPRAIAELKRAHPRLAVTVREGSPEVLQAELQAGRVDLIVGRLTRVAPEYGHHEPLYEERIRVVVGDAHPLARASAVAWSAAMRYPWILPGSDTELRVELERFFAARGFAPPANRVETTSFLIVRQLLIDTHMVAALPALIAQTDARLAALPLTLESVGHQVGMTMAQGRRLGPAAQAMIAALRSVARRL